MRRLRTRTRTIAALALAGAGLLATLAVPMAGTASAAIGPITWADDFDGPAGQAPNGSRWKFDTGGSGFGNNELQYYTPGNANAALDGQGHLVITARRENPANYGCWYGTCQYTSARILTADRFTQAYGRFEARLKIPRGQGIWPAFWMLGNDIGTVGWPNSGEIDIMENVGREPGTVHGSLHGPGYSGGNPLGGQYTLPGGRALADDYHTFAVDWAPDSITWYIDGIQYSRKTPADAGGNRWVFDHPFFMILNVAVGGNWPGSPDGSTAFPQTMTIDYVRVYSWTTGGGGTTSAIRGYGGRCVDVPGGNGVDGARLQIWDCNGTPAQRWTFATDGTIRALGKCMDVANASTANGAAVQLVTCNGNAAQQFTLTGAGDLVNPMASRCVDVVNVNPNNGAQLQMWDCTGGANQKWARA